MQQIAALPRGSGQWNSYITTQHQLGGVGVGKPTTSSRIASGQWSVELMLHTATLPRGSGQWNLCITPPHCPGAMSGGKPTKHCRTGSGRCAVRRLPYIASLPVVASSGAGAAHSQTTRGDWAAGLLQYTATLLGGSMQLDCRNTLAH